MAKNNLNIFSSKDFIIILFVIVIIFLMCLLNSRNNMTQNTPKTINVIGNSQGGNLDGPCGDTLFDAYSGPFKTESLRLRPSCKSGSVMGLPINIKTQSIDSDFRQIGILTSNNQNSLILPLLGRPLITHRDMWQYYALSERNIKLPVINANNKNCTNEYGCNSLYDGDIVTVNGYPDTFNVSLYQNNENTYIPYL